MTVRYGEVRSGEEETADSRRRTEAVEASESEHKVKHRQKCCITEAVITKHNFVGQNNRHRTVTNIITHIGDTTSGKSPRSFELCKQSKGDVREEIESHQEHGFDAKAAHRLAQKAVRLRSGQHRHSY